MDNGVRNGGGECGFEGDIDGFGGPVGGFGGVVSGMVRDCQHQDFWDFRIGGFRSFGLRRLDS